MTAIDSLRDLKSDWIETIPGNLAQIEGVRSRFQEVLIPFFKLLDISLETGEPTWLDSILTDWVTAPTETELDEVGQSFVEVINKIQLGTLDLIQRKLPQDEALELAMAVIPIFAHAVQFTATQEVKIRVNHITNELHQANIVVERLEKNKSDFISVAAHELKTPLTLIEGYSSMLQDAISPDELKSSQVELCLKGVDAGTKRLQEIVDDMVDVSLIDNDALSLAYQPIWLNQILNALFRELNESIAQRKINYSVEKFPGLNEMFFGDGERLYQAIRNVITNAIKYTPDEGRISISGRMLPGFLELTVTDTGIGIDPEDHLRIFEKFGRIGDVALHSSGKTKFKGGGPGLGLPITKGIIEAHGGAIWVESDGYDEQRCPGTTFHIMLPLQKAPPDDKSQKLFRNIAANMEMIKS